MPSLRANTPGTSRAWPPVIAAIYIFCQPLLDVCNGVMLNSGHTVTPGMVVRPVFMVLSLAYFIFWSKFPHKRQWMIYLCVNLLYLIFFMAHLHAIGGLPLCVANLHDTARCFYPPIILAFLYALYQQYGYLTTIRTLSVVGTVYASIIPISIATNTSFVAYGSSGYGFRGWFAATNEVGCIIGLIGPLTIYRCLDILGSVHQKDWWKGALAAWSMAVIAISANFLGTKVIFLLIVLYLLLTCIWQIAALRRSPTRSRKIQAAAAGIMFAFTLLLYPISPLRGYLNTIYLELLHNNPALELVTWNPELEAASIGSWMWTLIRSNETVALVDQILSRRLLYASPSLQVYADGNAAVKLLGIGYADAPAYSRPVHFPLEIDPLSILVRHGALGFSILYVPYIVFIVYTIARVVRHPSRWLSDLRACTVLYCTLMCFSVSFLVGHVLVSTGVSIFVLATGMLVWDQMQCQTAPEVCAQSSL